MAEASRKPTSAGTPGSSNPRLKPQIVPPAITPSEPSATGIEAMPVPASSGTTAPSMQAAQTTPSSAIRPSSGRSVAGSPAASRISWSAICACTSTPGSEKPPRGPVVSGVTKWSFTLVASLPTSTALPRTSSASFAGSVSMTSAMLRRVKRSRPPRKSISIW